MIDAGSNGLCILANFSEQLALADEERQPLTAAILGYVAGRVPVTGLWMTATVVATLQGSRPRKSSPRSCVRADTFDHWMRMLRSRITPPHLAFSAAR